MAKSNLKGEHIGVTASNDEEAPDFEDVPFWVEPESDPELDSFAIIEREGEVLQFGRIHSGKEQSERASPERQQRDTSMDFQGRDIRESTLDPEVIRLLRIDLLGEIPLRDDGELTVRRPTKLPQVGRSVYKLGASDLPELLKFPKPEDDSGLEIGEIESGGETVSFKLNPTALSRHIAILGRTGTGKTHTAHVIIEELVEQDVPVVTFDLEDDVGAMADYFDGTTIQPNTDDMSIPFHFIGWNEFARFLGDMPSKKQKEVIGQAHARVRNQALRQLDEEGEIDVPIGEFAGHIRDVADNMDYNYEGAAVGRALSAIQNSDVLGQDMGNWTERMINNRIVNIDLSAVSDAERGMVISATARMLQRLREREEVPPFVLAIDEAHEFVPAGNRGESTEVVRDLVKTARHIGVGVMLMTQSPSELDEKTLRTINTYVVLALAEGEVRKVKGLLADLTDQSLGQIPDMEQGRAFVGTARDIMLHTVPINVRDRTSPDGSPTPNLVEVAHEWRDSYDGESTTTDLSQFDGDDDE